MASGDNSSDSSLAFHTSQNTWVPYGSTSGLRYEEEFVKFISKQMTSTQIEDTSDSQQDQNIGPVDQVVDQVVSESGEVAPPKFNFQFLGQSQVTDDLPPVDFGESDNSDDVTANLGFNMTPLQVIPETPPSQIEGLDSDELPDIEEEEPAPPSPGPSHAEDEVDEPLSIIRHFYKDHFDGEVRKWESFTSILEDCNRHVVEIPAQGYGLIECVKEYLEFEYNIKYSINEIVEKVAKELVTNPEYTKYHQKPLHQSTVDSHLTNVMNNKHGRLLMDMYLPALATALNIQIRVCQEVHGYIAMVNTLPLVQSNGEKRYIMLVWEEDKYKCILRKKEKPHQRSPVLKSSLKRSRPGSIQNKKKVSFFQTRMKEMEMEKDIIVIDSSSDEDSLSYTEQLDTIMQKIKKEPVSPPLPTIFAPISRGRFFNMAQFNDLTPEVVDSIPPEINGTKYYLIDCCDDDSEDDWQKKYKDSRYFTLNTSKRKGFRGVRRIGKCQGNYRCQNEECPMLISEGKTNQSQFKTIAGNKFCNTCDVLAKRNLCGAVKLIEYSPSTKILTVYHSGNHSCSPKVNQQENDVFIEKVLKETSGRVGPRQLAQIKMSKELENQKRQGCHDMTAIVNIASQLTDTKRISYIKSKIQSTLRSEVHSLSAVGELKTVTDSKDKFYIYRINDSNLNSKLSYVFKFSRRMADIAIQMDQTSSENSVMKGEFIYFDGMHKRCQNWKTLTSWVYHPPSRRLLRLATMEAKGETTEYVTLFWKLFNEVLAEVKGDDDYKFNPRGWITDEAGANFRGIANTFGEDILQGRIFSCAMHFRECLKNLCTKIPAELEEVRNEVYDVGMQLLKVATLDDYNEHKTRLNVIGGLVPAVENWIKWWDARRYHLFPVFRGYSISSLNMAEIGHSTLKRNKPIMLVDAAWEDVCSIIIQEEELLKFLAGTGRSHGRGPTTAAIAQKERKQQNIRAKEYSQALKAGDTSQFMENAENTFLPAKKARHKAPNTFSSSNPVQGTTLGRLSNTSSAESQDIQISTSQPVASGSGQGGDGNNGGPRPLQVITNTPAKKFIAETDNPPLLVFLNGFNIKVCYGCKKKFEQKLRNPPQDLVCKLLVMRDKLINGAWVPGWRRSWAYFHLSLSCLRLSRSTIEADDVYISNDVYNQLTPDHRYYLQRIGWWHHMRHR